MKKTCCVILVLALLVSLFCLPVSAASYAAGSYVQKINTIGTLTNDNLKAATKGTDFDAVITVTPKSEIVWSSGVRAVDAYNIDQLFTFKSGTKTLTYSGNLITYFDVSGTISGNTATATFADKSANDVKVYLVTDAITTWDTDVTAKVSEETRSKYVMDGSGTYSATISQWITMLASLNVGIRLSGTTNENSSTSDFAKVTATVDRKSGAKQVVTVSVTNTINDLLPGDTVTLTTLLKDEADKEFYAFNCWVDGSGNVLSTDPSITYTANGNSAAIYATYIELKNRFVIDYSAGIGGQIIPETRRDLVSKSNQVSVMEGKTVLFYILPDNGYEIAHLYIDGRNVIGGNANQLHPSGFTYGEQGIAQFQFLSVACDHSIAADFQKVDSGTCTAHRFSEWKTLLQATCLQQGIEFRDCSECGYRETRSVPKTQHQIESIVCPAYFNGIKFEGKRCSVCGEYLEEEILSDEPLNSGYTDDHGLFWSVDSSGLLSISGFGKQISAYTVSDPAPWAACADNIHSVSIGASIKEIGEYAFFDCTGVTDVYYIGFEEEWERITIGDHNDCLLNATMHFITPKIIAPNVTARNIAGQKIRMQVCLENNPGIIATLLRLNYDSGKLKLIDVQSCAMIDSYTKEFGLSDIFYTGNDLASIPYSSFWLVDDATVQEALQEESISGYPLDGTLITYTFEVLEGAESGSTPIEITYDPGSTFNSDLEYVKFETVNGSINLIDCLPGDVDADGHVGLMDVAILARYLAGGYNVSISKINSDVDRDGYISAKDVALIKRYLAGWNVELK